MSETKGPCEVKPIREKNTSEINEIEKHFVRKKEQGSLLEPCRLKDIRIKVAMNKNYKQALRLKREAQRTIKINYGNTPVGNGRN